MKTRVIGMAGVVAAALSGGGCGMSVAPDASSGTAAVRVEARAKEGTDRGWVRVAVYDAAPVKAEPAGEFEHVDYRHLSDVVVWLEAEGGKAAGASARPVNVEVDAGKEARSVSAAGVGQRVVFHNRSGEAVSLYSVSDGNEFELAGVEAGGTAEYVAKTEGLIEVLADASRPPVARVYAAPSAWVARAGAGETVVFRDVPPGKYRVVAWHPRLPAGSSEVTLKAGEVTAASVGVGVNTLAGVAP